jgi:hypothetical protein
MFANLSDDSDEAIGPIWVELAGAFAVFACCTLKMQRVSS